MYNKDIELRHLRYFIAVAEELHFSRAAAKLQIAQPALSQQIRQLEQILGTRLFERNHHNVTLTSMGQLFYVEARAILNQVEQTLSKIEQARQGHSGHLAIGFIGSAADIIIPDILSIYLQRFPGVEVHLCDLNTQEQIRALQEQEIQIGFFASIHTIPASLATTVVQRSPLVAIFAHAHRLANQASITLQELNNEPFILLTRQKSHFFHKWIIDLCNKTGFSPLIKQEVTDVRMLLGLVGANLGISIIPATSIPIHNQNIASSAIADLDAAIELSLVWNRQDTSPQVQAFLDIAHEILSTRAAPLTSSHPPEASA